MPEPFLASVPTRRDAPAAPPGVGNAAEVEKSLAPSVERHGVASGVRTSLQGRQAFRVCPALLSIPWRLHIGYAYLSDTTREGVFLEPCSPDLSGQGMIKFK